MHTQKVRYPSVKMTQRQIASFLEDVFEEEELHVKTVLSLSHGVLGVLHAASLAIHAIGRGLAVARGLKAKHTTKQIDRLLSNKKLPPRSLFKLWAPFVVGSRQEIAVALDWTEFAKDSHSTLALYLLTNHGRATPLCWLTVPKASLKGHRYQYESELIDILHDALDEDIRITLLCDRGFGDQARYDHLDLYGWDFIIRFRGNILVTDEKGESRKAKDWIPASGRATKLPRAKVTEDKTEVGAVVVVYDKKMKEGWCLATNRNDLLATQVVALYGKRFRIEETFRDIKDPHFGMGLSATHIKNAERRDRLLLLLAVAYALLCLLGAAGEKAGLDRTLKTNTVAKRTLSLFNQGRFWFDALPNLPKPTLRLLMTAFDEVVREHAFFRHIFGVL